LEALPTLRVLMLGKNKISRIEGLEPLSRLDVLDLHSNQIDHIGSPTQIRANHRADSVL
jgi:Leucine-rich repeat (LRR) protein